ncbi:septum formation family protein [Lysinimonas soli]|uniref:Septum formation family protein n=1 Tax=Lysinimonas soli TaxID=1074233 RepID=A0ABW0NNF3_9MICO
MTRITRYRARALAMTTIAAAALLLCGCSVVNQLTGTTQRDASGTPTAANSNADVFSIKVGDCLNDASAQGTVTTAPIVPCSQPHDSEAYKSITMAAGKFPGDAAVKDQADTGCADAFAAFIGISYADSSLKISYYFPTETSWNTRGDRQIMCTVYDDGVKTTGTLKGAAR